MKKVIGITTVLTLLLSGCGNSIDTVKNGILSKYESTTIGQAFENYSYAIQTTWEDFETKNGQKFVDVTIELKFPPLCEQDSYCNNTKNLQNFLNIGFGAYVYPEWRQKVEKDGKSEECKNPEAYSGNVNIQFLINKNGGFETSFVALEYLIQDESTKNCKHLTTAEVLINNQKGQQLYKSILDAIYSDEAIY